MNKAQTLDLLQYLAQRFDTKPPRLRWHRKTTIGFYNEETKVISVGPRCWRGIEDSLIHEFGHFLEWKTIRKQREWKERLQGKRLRMSHHSKYTFSIIAKIARVVYGDVTKYAWMTEYPRGRKFAISKGWRKP